MDIRKIIFPNTSNLQKRTIGYSFFYLIILFIFLSFIGWIWEVSLYLIISHKFINRGILLGPWLPIYGLGGIFLFFILYRFKNHPLYVFLFSVIVCSLLEYFTSWFLEKKWGVRWWDYSNNILNLNGRICLLCSLGFGIGAVLILYIFIPIFEYLYDKIPPKVRITISLILLILFIIDGAYSAVSPNNGNGITY